MHLISDIKTYIDNLSLSFMDLVVFRSVKALPKNKHCRTRPYGRQLWKEKMSNPFEVCGYYSV